MEVGLDAVRKSIFFGGRGDCYYLFREKDLNSWAMWVVYIGLSKQKSSDGCGKRFYQFLNVLDISFPMQFIE